LGNQKVPGLSEKEFREIFNSVGSHLTNRVLSPVEVAFLFDKSISAGGPLAILVDAFSLSESMIKKFLKLTQLSHEILFLVEWGTSKYSCIGFSCAVELCGLGHSDYVEMSRYIVKHGIRKKEMISIRQLRLRSKDSLESCVERVLKRRPVVVTRFVYVGSITSNEIRNCTKVLNQFDKDDLLKKAIQKLYPLIGEVGLKLSNATFMIIGSKKLDRLIEGESDFEAKINAGLILQSQSIPAFYCD